MTRGRAVALVAGVLMLVAVAVGAAAASQTAGTYRETVYIDIHYSRFDASRLRVPVGVPVRFVIRNLDPIDHEWIVGDERTHTAHRTGTEAHHGARPTEISVPPLTTVETIVTFPTRGSQLFICHLPGHEQYGMIGTLSVR